MHFSSLVATSISLAATAASAAAIVGSRQPGRLGQVRFFGAEGCYDLNLGFATVDEVDVGVCHTDYFTTGEPTAIKSVELQQFTDAADGCTYYVYTDTACSEGQMPIDLNVCADVSDSTASWQSGQILCTSSAA